jgi:hypothetical protein
VSRFVLEYLFLIEPVCQWVLSRSEESLMTARWYAAWILVFDISIIFCMYGVWATLTLTGRLGSSSSSGGGGGRGGGVCGGGSSSSPSSPGSGLGSNGADGSYDLFFGHGKHSMTGLNLSGGNGILNYDNSSEKTTVGSSKMGFTTTAVQRITHSNSQGSSGGCSNLSGNNNSNNAIDIVLLSGESHS